MFNRQDQEQGIYSDYNNNHEANKYLNTYKSHTNHSNNNNIHDLESYYENKQKQLEEKILSKRSSISKDAKTFNLKNSIKKNKKDYKPSLPPKYLHTAESNKVNKPDNKSTFKGNMSFSKTPSFRNIKEGDKHITIKLKLSSKDIEKVSLVKNNKEETIELKMKNEEKLVPTTAKQSNISQRLSSTNIQSNRKKQSPIKPLVKNNNQQKSKEKIDNKKETQQAVSSQSITNQTTNSKSNITTKNKLFSNLPINYNSEVKKPSPIKIDTKAEVTQSKQLTPSQMLSNFSYNAFRKNVKTEKLAMRSYLNTENKPKTVKVITNNALKIKNNKDTENELIKINNKLDISQKTDDLFNNHIHIHNDYFTSRTAALIKPSALISNENEEDSILERNNIYLTDFNNSPKVALSTDNIRKIYLNRSSRRESISQSQMDKSKQNEKKETFYDKNLKWKQEKENKIKLIRDSKKDKELDGCTFMPVISKSTEKILYNSNKYDDTLSTFDKNIIWKRGVERNIQNKSLIKDRKLFQECLFEPQLSTSKLYLSTTNISVDKKKQPNDHMYNKTMEWKHKMESNRRQVDLENVEKRIKDTTSYIRRSNSNRKKYETTRQSNKSKEEKDKK